MQAPQSNDDHHVPFGKESGMRSKRLSRQLKKTFGDESPEESLTTLLALPESEASKETIRRIAEAFPEFLEQVQKSYDEMEEKVAIAQRSVDISNAELTEVNSNLFSLNKTFQAMINSLGQGFFLFGRDGICLPVYTKACETLLEKVPAGQRAADVLGVPAEKQGYFERWTDLLFREVIEFSEIANAGPSSYTHSKNLSIAIEYKPVRDFDGKIELIVAIVTDRTNEVRAKNEANEMHAFAVLVSSIIRDRERFRRYVESARGILKDAWTMIDRESLSETDLTLVKRQLHTLKGAASSFGMARVKDAAHDLESRIGQEHDRRIIHAVLLKGLPEISQLFESILVMHADVIGDALREKDPIREVPLPVLLEFDATLANLGFVGEPARTKFQTQIISVAVAKIFGCFNITLQELALSLGKKIAPIEITGGDIRVRPEPLTNLLASLVHVFRNIADHGIESEPVRLRAGKQPEGRVWMRFEPVIHKGQSYLCMKIGDDGNGIDVERIKAKLKTRGESIDGLTHQALMEKIFASGVSKADKVTEFSGRGEGLGAVKDDVEAIGGSITVESKLGEGTTFTLLMPCLIASEASPKVTAAA